MVKKVLFV